MFLDGTFYDICTAISSKHETNKMVQFTTSAHQPLTAKRVTLFQHICFSFFRLSANLNLSKFLEGNKNMSFLSPFFSTVLTIFLYSIAMLCHL